MRVSVLNKIATMNMNNEYGILVSLNVPKQPTKSQEAKEFPLGQCIITSVSQTKLIFPPYIQGLIVCFV